MLTNEDVQKLLKVFETKFATKEDLVGVESRLNQKFDTLMSAVDTYAKKADTYFQEMVMFSHKIELLEKWIHQIAEKTGIELKY